MSTKNPLLYMDCGLDRATQAIILFRFDELREEWREATGGDLEKVTLDLNLLFEDIERIIKTQ